MKPKLRKIPYGTMNWAEIVRECHFVDKTAYIRELEQVKTPVFLRPKRFGKTLVCSMLAHYYDIALKDRFDELFGKTDILYPLSTILYPLSVILSLFAAGAARGENLIFMMATILKKRNSCHFCCCTTVLNMLQ